MALVPNISFANPNTPLFAPAGSGGGGATPPTELVIASPIIISPVPGPPGVSVTGLDTYNTSANVWYDVSINGILGTTGGVPNLGDQLILPLALGADPTDSFKLLVQINTLSPATTFTLRVRHKTVIGGQILLDALVDGVGTGTYQLELYSVNVTAVPA